MAKAKKSESARSNWAVNYLRDSPPKSQALGLRVADIEAESMSSALSTLVALSPVVACAGLASMKLLGAEDLAAEA